MNSENKPNPPEDSQPEIIVDDNWKSQVESEKKQIQDAMDAPPEHDDQELPPATLPVLITTLATQSMVALGLIPDPSGQTSPNKAVAKHFIDTLDMLQEKTKGNTTPEEDQMFSELLHQLKMAFVAVPDSSDLNTPQSDTKPTIELP